MYNYFLFVFELITIVFMLFLVISLFLYLAANRYQDKCNLRVINLSNYYHDIVMKTINLTSIKFFKENIQLINQIKHHKSTVYVLNFFGDVHASEITYLREAISIIITIAQPNDEVILKLESAGGTVHEYGLAAAQLQRLRSHNIKLIVVVDKIAASGGYMMACVANYIYAAPFSIIGSIGVIGQVPNLNKFLKKYNIDIELHTAGNHKRNLTIFGENKDIHRKHFQDQLNTTHDLFKKFIHSMRPEVNIDEVSNGDHWFGSIAYQKKLIDGINTSDDVILSKINKFNIVLIDKKKEKKLFKSLTYLISKIFLNILNIKNDNFINK